jgi:hypothetical protein
VTGDAAHAGDGAPRPFSPGGTGHPTTLGAEAQAVHDRQDEQHPAAMWGRCSFRRVQPGGLVVVESGLVAPRGTPQP